MRLASTFVTAVPVSTVSLISPDSTKTVSLVSLDGRKETTRLGCAVAVNPFLCSDDLFRPPIRPIPSARVAVAAIKSKPQEPSLWQ